MVMIWIALTAFAVLMPLAAQDHQHNAALNARGKQFMGFDQEATAHHFILTKDGGRIEVSAKAGDDVKSQGEIRAHLRHIAQAFTSGDFSVPALVHDQKVPGVAKMKAAGASLTYTFEEIQRGALIRISGSSLEAVAAAHEFLKFQIKDHGTGDPLVAK